MDFVTFELLFCVLRWQTFQHYGWRVSLWHWCDILWYCARLCSFFFFSEWVPWRPVIITVTNFKYRNDTYYSWRNKSDSSSHRAMTQFLAQTLISSTLLKYSTIKFNHWLVSTNRNLRGKMLDSTFLGAMMRDNPSRINSTKHNYSSMKNRWGHGLVNNFLNFITGETES